MKKRRYEVTGIDDLGDVHTFGTDDLERADEIVAIMREDLEDVELVQNRSAQGEPATPAHEETEA